MTPREFLLEYSGLRKQHDGVGKDLTPRNIRTAAIYLKWCAKHEVEPVPYLQSYINWSMQAGKPFPKLGFLRSKRGLGIWRKFAEGYSLEERADERLTKEMQTRPPPEFKLRHAQEKFKGFYIGNRALCARYGQHTGGYNPKSNHCSGCSSAPSCRSLGAHG